MAVIYLPLEVPLLYQDVSTQLHLNRILEKKTSINRSQRENIQNIGSPERINEKVSAAVSKRPVNHEDMIIKITNNSDLGKPESK